MSLKKFFRSIRQKPAVRWLLGSSRNRKIPAAKADKLSRESRRRLIRNIWIVASVLFATCGIVLIMQGNTRIRDERQDLEINEGSFDEHSQIIESGDPAVLRRSLEKVADTSSQTIPERIEAFRRKSEIAKRLLKIGDNSDIEFATHALIASELQLQRTLVQSGLISEVNLKQLDSIATSSLESNNEAIRKSAALATVFADCVRLRKSTVSLRETALQRAKSTMSSMASKHPEDVALVRDLVTVINDLADQQFDTTLLLQFVLDAYRDNKNPDVLQTVELVEEELFRREFRIPRMTATLAKSTESTINNYIKRIDTAKSKIETGFTSNSKAPVEACTQLATALSMAVQVAPNNTSKKLVAESKSVFEFSDAYGALIKPKLLFEKLNKIVQQLDQPVPIHLLVDAQEKPIANTDVDATLLVFLDSDSIAKAKKPVIDFGAAFRTLTKNEKLDICIVYQLDGEETDAQQKLNSLVLETTGVRSRIVQKSYIEAFQDRVPMPWLPSWILIDKSGVMRSFNRSPALMQIEMPEVILGH